MTIAFLGATGMLGRPVDGELLAAGHAVRIVSRTVERARILVPTADVVYGDLSRPESLIGALAGSSVAYLNLSIEQTEKPADFHTETDGLRHLLIAARQA